MRLPFHYNICPSQMKYQMKKFWLRTSVYYEQLLSSVSYATLCPIRNSMFMFFLYWTIHQLLWSKIEFLCKFNKFQPLKLFLEILVYQPSWFKI